MGMGGSPKRKKQHAREQGGNSAELSLMNHHRFSVLPNPADARNGTGAEARRARKHWVSRLVPESFRSVDRFVAGRTTSQLACAVREHAPGPLGEDVRSLTHASALWFVVCGNAAIVLAIVWNMTVKPGTAGAIGAVVAGYALGVVAAIFARA